jgi:hypothetical protein
MKKEDILFKLAENAENTNSTKLSHFLIVDDNFDSESLKIDELLGGKVTYTAQWIEFPKTVEITIYNGDSYGACRNRFKSDVYHLNVITKTIL